MGEKIRCKACYSFSQKNSMCMLRKHITQLIFFGRITVVAKHIFKLTKWLHDFLFAKWRLSVQTLRIGAGVGPGCTFSSERLRACCCFALINGMGDDEMGRWIIAELVGD